MELGGPDYSKLGPRVTDSEGKALAEATGRGPGYRYFGAAKNLPGVKELFEREAPRQVRGAGAGWVPPAAAAARLRTSAPARLCHLPHRNRLTGAAHARRDASPDQCRLLWTAR